MADLRGQFRDPDNTYRMHPFWFLNHDLQEDELRRQIAQMDEKGLGGAVLHARHGLLTPYMGEEWMEAIGACIDELSSRGMEAWLYDEDNWPSGTDSGRLTRDHPQFRMRYLRVQTLQISGGATFQRSLPTNGDELVAIRAAKLAPDKINEPGGPHFTGTIRDLTDRCSEGRLRWEAPPGNWFAAIFWSHLVPDKTTFFDGSYLDTMNHEAVAEFRRRAYDPYECFSDDFGETVKGVFTDEPGLMIHDAYFGVEAKAGTAQEPGRTLPGVTLAWTRDMFEHFQNMHGYDLREHLLQLLFDTDDESSKVRLDYHRAISAWYAENFHGQLAGWCEKRDIELIGHTMEDPFHKQIRTQGDQLQALSKMHRPGFDYLCDSVDPGRILAAKCASSAAHIHGKHRVICEAFGGGGHETTLERQRVNLNFMCALGCNMVIPHAFYYSFEGLRKSDWPPTEFYHNGYWEWYKGFADYTARMCLIQAAGHHVCDALVMLPTETMAVDAWDQGEYVPEPMCARLLDFVSDGMLSAHHDYDYVGDDHLATAMLKNQSITFPLTTEEYSAVVLPGCRVISSETARKLVDFYKSGGTVIILGEMPSEGTQRGTDEDVRAQMNAIFPEAAEGPCEVRNDAGGVAVFAPEETVTQKWLEETLAEAIAPDVTMAGDPDEHRDIVCTHRADGDMHLYLLFNRGETPQEAELKVSAEGTVEEWDLERGRPGAAEHETTKTGTLFHCTLDAGEARLFVVDPNSDLQRLSSDDTVAPELLDEIELGDRWSFEGAGENVVILDRWQYIAYDQAAGKRLGVTGTPGHVNTFVTDFEVEGDIGPVRLVLDNICQGLPAHVGFLSGKRDVEVLVNGELAPPLENADWQDPMFMATDLTDLLQQGTNELQICFVSLLQEPQALTDPLYLVGDFAYESGVLRPPATQMRGYYSQSGYRHYPGIARYSTSVHIEPEFLEGGRRLILDVGEVRDCARIVVNGEEVAVRLWPPYEVDISDNATAGRNEITVEVTGTLANLYGKADEPAGISGPARIWVIG